MSKKKNYSQTEKVINGNGSISTNNRGTARDRERSMEVMEIATCATQSFLSTIILIYTVRPGQTPKSKLHSEKEGE